MEAISTPTGPLAEAMSRIDAGQLDDALSLLRKLVQQKPSDGHLHALIGVCNAQQGKLEAAVASLETAALLNPGDRAVENKLAWALFQVGRVDQAKWRLTRILEADASNEEAQQLLVHIQGTTAATAPGPTPTGSKGVAHSQQAPAAVSPPPVPAPAPDYTRAPGTGLRLLRGIGWGLLYSQTWTVFSLFGAVLISLLTTRVEHAVLAFILLALTSTLFHSAMGVLTGVVLALLNADEGTGSWVGMSVGLLILLIGLQAGVLSFWGVVFYILVGRWIGRSIAGHVQKPVAA